jgi:hypothetical protein
MLVQAIAAAGLEDHVAQLVFLGDPDRAFERAYRASRAVQHFQQLAGVEPQAAGLKFEFHGRLLAFSYANNASDRRRLKAIKIQDKDE